jgi:hypothetical protein
MTNYSGVKIANQTFGEACPFGTPVYLKSDGKWWKTNASSAATCTGDVGLCLEASIGAGGAGAILTFGYVENPAWSWVLGSPVYFGTTAGTLTQTKPSSGGVIRVAGYPTSAIVLHLVPADPVIPESLIDISGLAGTRGDVLIRGESGWTQLHAGIGGQFLRTRGSGYDPLWDWAPVSGAEPIGVMWETTSSSPTLTRVDANGATIAALTTADFDHHPIYGQMWRCVRNRTTGEITYGLNARGDGLTLDGSAGDVLVRVPRFYVKASASGTKRYWWVSPTQYPGYEPHPWFYQRGGSLATEAYVSAYEAYGYLDTAFRLGSATGQVPVTGGVAYPDLPNSGRLTIDDVEAYAKNAGLSGGLDFWGWCALQLLFYVECASLDSQTALAKGITELPSGVGFAGKNTGADSADLNIGSNGTGAGTGTNGQTPVVWRGIENLWGNTWTFVVGANFYPSDGTYRLLKRDGAGTPAGTLAAGSYEVGSGVVPPVDGYISGFLAGDLENLAFLPGAAAGSSSTYACDYWWYPRNNPSILLAGGCWCNGAYPGVGCRNATDAVSYSGRSIGARVEFIPQGA